MGEGRGVYSVFVGRPEGWRQQERPKSRWEDDRNRLSELDAADSGENPMAGFCGHDDELSCSINRVDCSLTSQVYNRLFKKYHAP